MLVLLVLLVVLVVPVLVGGGGTGSPRASTSIGTSICPPPFVRLSHLVHNLQMSLNAGLNHGLDICVDIILGTHI